jgi:hypothetical protein
MRNCPHARVTCSRSQAVVHRRSYAGMSVNVAIGEGQSSSELIRAHRTPCAPSSSGLYLGAGSIARRPVSFESLQNLAQLASVIFFNRESNSGCAVLGISGSIDAFSRKRRSRACECEHPKSASVSQPSVSRRLIARGHQRSSEAIRGRRPSERSSEMSSEVISGQQRSTKRSSERSFKAIRGNHHAWMYTNAGNWIAIRGNHHTWMYTNAGNWIAIRGNHHTWMYTNAGNWISAIEPNMFQNAPMPARLRVCSPAAVSASMPSSSMKKSKSS